MRVQKSLPDHANCGPVAQTCEQSGDLVRLHGLACGDCAVRTAGAPTTMSEGDGEVVTPKLDIKGLNMGISQSVIQVFTSCYEVNLCIKV